MEKRKELLNALLPGGDVQGSSSDFRTNGAVARKNISPRISSAG
jgi:hypothetical protein